MYINYIMDPNDHILTYPMIYTFQQAIDVFMGDPLPTDFLESRVFLKSYNLLSMVSRKSALTLLTQIIGSTIQ